LYEKIDVEIQNNLEEMLIELQNNLENISLPIYNTVEEFFVSLILPLYVQLNFISNISISSFTSIFIEKFIPINEEIQLISEFTSSINKFLNYQSNLYLETSFDLAVEKLIKNTNPINFNIISDIQLSITTYRKLLELDSLILSEIDNMSLDDITYIDVV